MRTTLKQRIINAIKNGQKREKFKKGNPNPV
jgi:hypothetical protein